MKAGPAVPGEGVAAGVGVFGREDDGLWLSESLLRRDAWPRTTDCTAVAASCIMRSRLSMLCWRGFAADGEGLRLNEPLVDVRPIAGSDPLGAERAFDSRIRRKRDWISRAAASRFTATLTLCCCSICSRRWTRSAYVRRSTSVRDRASHRPIRPRYRACTITAAHVRKVASRVICSFRSRRS